MEQKRKVFPILLGILFIVVAITIGVSYAVWQLTLKQSGTNVVTTGCFKVEFTGRNPISLESAYPISDEEGKALTPYSFTITNLCDSEANYYINLETVTTAEKKLSERYLKASLKKGDSEVFLNNLDSSFMNLDKVIPEASNAYKLYQGKLKAKEASTFYLNLWVDNETEAIDEVMNATYEGKIAILTSYRPPVDTRNLMLPMTRVLLDETVNFEIWGNSLYTQNGKYGKYNYIENVYYENTLNPYEDAVEVVDFSVAQDRSVLGYYVKNESNENYTLYIQANGKIKVNPESSYYGFITSDHTGITHSLYGIENWDTSLVTNMSYMFYESSATNLDLGHFDTSNVTNMSHMFSDAYGLTSLDLSSFDTSNVTDMSGMFCHAQTLTSLDLSSFNTSNVTDMSEMFSFTRNLTSLNLSGFNTSKVINMNKMFYFLESLTNLDLSSFDTSNVTDMAEMFSWAEKLTSLDLSSFDTSNVTNMYAMFSRAESLINLNLSSFDTTNVTNMYAMFEYTSKLSQIVYGDKFVYANSAYISSMFSNCPANKPTHESWNGLF